MNTLLAKVYVRYIPPCSHMRRIKTEFNTQIAGHLHKAINSFCGWYSAIF